MSTDPSAMAGWPDGVDCILLDEADSTNAEAARRARDISAPTWIMARHQTAARGRRGRAWVNPAGNFAATLLMHPACSPAEASLRSFMAANALYYTLGELVDRAELSLKWPNDVLLNGGKVAGILLESSSGAGGDVDWLAIGIGVNLANAPESPALEPGAVSPCSVIGEGGASATPEEFLASLAGHFAHQERLLAQFGFGAVRTMWMRHAARLGREITARTGREDISGIFDTVDETGNLILRTAEGTRAISAADIYFD